MAPHQGVCLCVSSQVGQSDHHIGDVLLRHRLQVVHQYTDCPTCTEHTAIHIPTHLITQTLMVQVMVHVYFTDIHFVPSLHLLLSSLLTSFTSLFHSHSPPPTLAHLPPSLSDLLRHTSHPHSLTSSHSHSHISSHQQPHSVPNHH